MEVAVDLLVDRGDRGGQAVAGVLAAEAAGEVDVAVRPSASSIRAPPRARRRGAASPYSGDVALAGLDDGVVALRSLRAMRRVYSRLRLTLARASQSGRYPRRRVRDVVAVVLSLVAGLAGSIQVAVSGAFGKRIGVLEATAFGSIGAALIVCAVLLVARQGFGNLGQSVREPAWLWLGGVMGAIVVTSITFTAPRIGTFATIGLLIAGQLAMGVLIDAFGLFGLEKIPVTPAASPACSSSPSERRSSSSASRVRTVTWDPTGSTGERLSRGDGLRLQVHLQRLEGLLAAEAGLLVAAEGDARKGAVGEVDRERARLDAPSEAVAAPGRPSRPSPSARSGRRWRSGRRPPRPRKGSPRAPGRRSPSATVWSSRHAGEHGRRIERAVALDRLAARDHLGALAAPGLHEAVHLLPVGLRDERAHLRLGVERVADRDGARLLGDEARRRRRRRSVRRGGASAVAALAGRVVDPVRRRGDGVLEVGVGEDERRALAAELKETRFTGSAQRRMISEPVAVEPVNETLSMPGVGDEVGPGRRPVARDDVDRPRGSRPRRELGEPERRERRRGSGLRTAVQPAASAGASFQPASMIG